MGLEWLLLLILVGIFLLFLLILGIVVRVISYMWHLGKEDAHKVSNRSK